MENSQTSPLLEDLTKKDEDLKVVSEGVFGTIVETHLDFGYDLTPEEPEEIVIETLSIPVRIVRHVFVINVSIAFLYALFGMVPYSLMEEGPRIVAYTLLGSSIVLSVLCAALMYFYRDHRVAGVSLFAMWVFITFFVVCSLAATLHSFAPFQACTIFFIQCTAGLLYCLYAGKDQVSPYWAAMIMMGSGLAVWALGLYAFINQQDWIESGLLFLVCVLFAPLYSALEIKFIMGRYNMEELVKANIEFFVALPLLKFHAT